MEGNSLVQGSGDPPVPKPLPNLVHMPDEIKIQICEYLYESSRWDILVQCERLKTPKMKRESLRGRFYRSSLTPVFRRLPPLSKSLSLTHSSLARIATPIRQQARLGYTGRFIIEDIEGKYDDIDRGLHNHWTRPLIAYVPIRYSDDIPEWIRHSTTTVGFPHWYLGSGQFGVRPYDWAPIPETVKNAFPNVTILERLDERLMEGIPEPTADEQHDLIRAEMEKWMHSLDRLVLGFGTTMRDHNLRIMTSCWHGRTSRPFEKDNSEEAFKWVEDKEAIGEWIVFADQKFVTVREALTGIVRDP